MYMMKPQTFDIFAVSIPDSNVQMAVARIMVGADKYLSMQDALEKVKTPPVLLFKNTDLRDAEQHIAKLKALGVGFRIVKAEDGTEDDSILRDDELPGGPPERVMKGALEKPPAPDAPEASPMPPLMSVQDAISRHHLGGGKNADAKGKGGGARGELTGFGSSSGGGAGGGGGGAGMRAGMGGQKASDEAMRKKRRLASIILSSVVVVLALLFFIFYEQKKFKVNKITIESVAGPKGIKHQSGGGKGGKDGKSGGGGSNKGIPGDIEPERIFDDIAPGQGQADGAARTRRRSSVNNQQKQQANNYVDSAKAGGTDLDKQVAFYKIAISFNRYNLPAWHGLLQTYREMKDSKNIHETEKQMREIFGDEVNSVNTAVAQYGEIMDAYVNESGAYRVEFKTKKTSKDDILRDVFNLTRAVRNSCNCTNISVYASTGPASGLIAHSTAATSVHTLPEFSQQANILWFD